MDHQRLYAVHLSNANVFLMLVSSFRSLSRQVYAFICFLKRHHYKRIVCLMRAAFSSTHILASASYRTVQVLIGSIRPFRKFVPQRQQLCVKQLLFFHVLSRSVSRQSNGYCEFIYRSVHLCFSSTRLKSVH